MTENMLGLLRRTGMSLASACALFAGYRRLLAIDRPVWMGVCLFLAVAGTATGWMALQRVRSRRRDHRIEPEPVLPSETPQNTAQKGIETLRGQWKAAIQFLKRSGLKKRGNPLYVLPWHLVIGAEGSGKTAALRGAGLPSFAGPNPVNGLAATAHCVWSFFEQAIVIDTAGRYAIQANPESDKEEWHTFLDLLLKYRRREPLNGLTITIPVDQLLAESSDALENTGKTLRKRIDELMRGVGAKFPVYVLVTKGDLIPGMSRFCERLSDQGLDQAMGCLSDEANADPAAFLDKTFATLTERLKNVRLILAAQPESETIDPSLLVLPERFDKLKNGLNAFLRGAFQENLYQETPRLRGVFFTSNAPTGRGAFLHDFFSQVLPADRALSVPTRRALSWRKGTWSLGLMAWIACAGAVCGFMSYSFMKNMQALSVLREADQEYSHLPNIHEDLAGALLIMDRLSQTLKTVDMKNSGWMSNFGLRDVAGVETALKEKVSNAFRHEILGPTDEQYNRVMTSFTASSSDILFSRYVAHLVERLSILREFFKGENLTHLQKTSLLIPSLRAGNGETDFDTKAQYGRLYVDSVFWTADTAALHQEEASLQAQLKHLLALKGRDPRWLISWAAASQDSIPSLMLSEFWKGHSPAGREPSIPGLFSAQGKSMIDAFFQEIAKTLDDPAVSSELKAGFERWYHENAFQTWHQFTVDFPRGQDTLSNAEAWRQTAARMAGDDGPYFALLKHLDQEFEPVAAADLPPWVRHVRQVRELQKTVPFLKYRQALEKVAKAAADPSQAVQATAQAFDASAAPETSAFNAAFDALAQLKASAPRELIDDTAVWRLVSGPLEFLWEAARRETATHLQADWQDKVLAAATGLDGAQAMPVLLAKDGPVMGFAKGPAAPYMQWTPGNGFCAKAVLGEAVPFTSAFFPFINGAVWVSSVNSLQVSATASSPDTNAKAKRIPNIASVTLRCGGAKDQVLLNRRLRVIETSFNTVEKSFTWSSACSETLVEIEIAGTHLTKSYPGPYGFFAFLHDFKEGHHAFLRNDFPEQAKALKELNVDSITLHYRLKGAPNFAAPKAAPAKIAWSWKP